MWSIKSELHLVTLTYIMVVPFKQSPCAGSVKAMVQDWQSGSNQHPTLKFVTISKCWVYFSITYIRQGFHFVGYAFIDDTDLIQSYSDQQSIEEVISEMQQSLDTWEGGLHATGGAIAPGKSFWTMVAFHWSSGNWWHLKNNEAPGNIKVKDIAGIVQNLARLEPNVLQKP
jgi:hypothetical protein